MSLGQAPPAEDGRVRDPEELVEEDQELVRWGAASAREAADGQDSGRGSTPNPYVGGCLLSYLPPTGSSHDQWELAE